MESGAPSVCRVPGLERVLVSTGLGDRFDLAKQWCDQMGASFLEELAEAEVFDLFSEALHLKLLEKRRFQRALESAAAQKLPANAAESDSIDTARAAAGAAAVQGTSVFVKNTFLDLDDGERCSQLRRLSTEPPPEVLRDSDVEDEDDEEDTERQGNGAASPSAPSQMPPWLYKTMTCDGYEPEDEWAWANGDPNSYAWAEPLLEDCAPGTSYPSDDVAAQYDGMLVDVAAGSLACVDDDGNPGFHAAASAYGLGPQMVGVVMVPMEVMPAYAIAPVVHGPCFPGCVAVPMERFSRWPGEQYAPAAPERESRRNVLQRAFSVTSSIYRVRWTVDARKLKSKDTEGVSPPFELADGCAGFKMILRPRITSDTKGGASFKKARGKGTVELRCLDSDAGIPPTVIFRVSIGSPDDTTRQQPPRGPVRHDFSQRAICGLPRGQEEWNFGQVVDKATQTFVVCLEVLTGLAQEAATQ